MPRRSTATAGRARQQSRPVAPIKTTAPKTTVKNDIEVDEGRATVTYTLSITKSTAPYESIKIQAGMTVPYGASDELMRELDELLVVTKEKIINRISQDVDEVTNSLT